MHTRTGFLFALGLALGFAVASTDAEARPPTPFVLDLRLNGVAQRYTLSDGGASGLYGSSATCIPVTEGDVLAVECSAASHLCTTSTDAGCSTTATDVNYGSKLAADTLRKVVVDTSVSSVLCMVPVTGSANCPVWRLR